MLPLPSFSLLLLLPLLLLPSTSPSSVPTSIPNKQSKSIPNLTTTFLPLPHNRTLTLLLLGTAHISADSESAVTEVMETMDPDYVCLELCHERAPAMVAEIVAENNISPPPPETPETPEISPPPPHTKVRPDPILSLITSLQSSYALGQSVTVGLDFKAALLHVSRSSSPTPPPVILLDRPVSLTISRLKTSLTPLSKLRLITGLLFQVLISRFNKKRIARYLQKALEDGTLLTDELAKLKKSLPNVHAVLVTERDEYLTSKLQQVLTAVASRGSSATVLAVVGKGHQTAISTHLKTQLHRTPISLLDPDYRAGERGRRKMVGGYSEEEVRFVAEECVVCDVPRAGSS